MLRRPNIRPRLKPGVLKPRPRLPRPEHGPTLIYTVSKNRIPDTIDRNLKKDDQISIVFGTNSLFLTQLATE